ncbi:MAG: hypothetical protein M3161_04670 [Actinomycetota bacterium]|nr:hypothetical protein [Actinomycetota bacterium]
MFTLNGDDDRRGTPSDAIDALKRVAAGVDGEIVFVTCIDDEGFVTDSECFTSLTQPKNLLAVDELFHLARELGARRIMITSRSSGPIDELHDCDVAFTARILDVGQRLGIRVCEHALVEMDSVRLMTEASPHLWEERGMALERDRDDGVGSDTEVSGDEGVASADVPGEGADRQGDPEPGEDTAGQSERARK